MSSQINPPPSFSTNSQQGFVRNRNRWFRLGVRITELCTLRYIRIVMTVATFSLLLWAFVWYFAHLVMTKSREARQDSFEYSFFISDFMQEMPAFKPLENSEHYFFRVISDIGKPTNTMQYESLAPADEIISYYRAYFEILHYSFVKHSFDTKDIAMFRNTREEFTLYVDEHVHANKVKIENTKLR